jgi:hypothetical protein
MNMSGLRSLIAIAVILVGCAAAGEVKADYDVRGPGLINVQIGL